MIDWQRVAELRSEIGEEDFAEVVDLFMEEVEATLARLGYDKAALGEDLHFLRGSAANLGFRALGQLCLQGERLCVAGEPDMVDLDMIRETYGESRAAFLAGHTLALQIRNSASNSSSVMSR